MKAAPLYNDEEKRFLAGYRIFCPGCEQYHILDQRWTFNGNCESPTFTPSLMCNRDYPERRCHSFITNGKIQFLSDCYHKLVGQTVELAEVEPW